MNKTVVKTPRSGQVTRIGVNTAPPFKRRGQGFQLVARPSFDSDGNRRPGTVSFEPIKPLVPVIPAAKTEQGIVASSEVKAPRKRNKKRRIEDQPVPLENLKWLTIAQTALRYPAFSEKAIRHNQAQAEAYQRHPKAGLRSNGFIDCIVRPAGQRKILIDAEKFENWLNANNMGAK